MSASSSRPENDDVRILLDLVPDFADRKRGPSREDDAQCSNRESKVIRHIGMAAVFVFCLLAPSARAQTLPLPENLIDPGQRLELIADSCPRQRHRHRLRGSFLPAGHVLGRRVQDPVVVEGQAGLLGLLDRKSVV